MNMYTRRKLKLVLAILVFVLCVLLVIVGQRNISWGGVLTMLAGIAGILVLLYLYNRSIERPGRD